MPAQVRSMPLIKVLHKGNIETIPLEKYVASVLAGEVHHSWPMEALKAQAIAARTYAMLRMKDRKANSYHVQNSVSDQVFKSKPSEIFIKAALETSGVVLTVDKDLAETSFHSTCGGKTANAKSVWGRGYRHLEGGNCGYCAASPTYTWETDISLSDVEKKFGQSINRIKIISRTKDGRVDAMQLAGSKKQSITGHEFRMAISPMKVKSTLITSISLDENRIHIKGGGFGHGVGMCQYGALGMAKAGKNYRDILRHYYPGTELKRFY